MRCFPGRDRKIGWQLRYTLRARAIKRYRMAPAYLYALPSCFCDFWVFDRMSVLAFVILQHSCSLEGFYLCGRLNIELLFQRVRAVWKQMAWSPLYRNACQKRILAHKLSLIYCEAKIVADSLFVDLFHAVAVRTTLLFWKEFLVKTTSACFHVIVAFYTSIQQCALPHQPLKWISDRYTTTELNVIRKFCARSPRRTTLFICLPKPYIFRNDQRYLSYRQ